MSAKHGVHERAKQAAIISDAIQWAAGDVFLVLLKRVVCAEWCGCRVAVVEAKTLQDKLNVDLLIEVHKLAPSILCDTDIEIVF